MQDITNTDLHLLEEVSSTSLLQEAEEAVEAESIHTSMPVEEEIYEIVDQYPDVVLPQHILDALEMDASLDELHEEYAMHLAAAEAAQVSLERKYMQLKNEAKAALLAEQQASDEATVTDALSDPSLIRLLAVVCRLAQQGRAGELINTLETLEHTPAQTSLSLGTTAGILTPPPEATPVTPITTQPAPTNTGWGAWG